METDTGAGTHEPKVGACTISGFSDEVESCDCEGSFSIFPTVCAHRASSFLGVTDS